MKELSEVLVDFPGCLVDESGNVYSCLKTVNGYNLKGKLRKRKLFKNKKGYYTITLTNRHGEKKNFPVHRLVALLYLDKPEGKNYVNHKNAIKSDNRVKNLEWCTPQENVTHAKELGLLRTGPNLKIRGKVKTQKPIRQLSLDGKFIREFTSVYAAARELDISMPGTAIRNCCVGNSGHKTEKKRNCYTAYGYKWEYAT